MERQWMNFLVIISIIIGLIIVGFFVYLWSKVYTIKGIVYCVYDNRDVYENLVIGSKEECEQWILAQDEEDRRHLIVTLYFDWKLNRKRK